MAKVREIQFVFKAPEEDLKRFAGDMGKYSKTVANYARGSDHSLDDLSRQCGHCAHFRPAPSHSADSISCVLVQGSISPTYVCRFFVRGG